MPSEERKHDLRDVVERCMGKPLAASSRAGLWRCPVCPRERHALLMVSADAYKCLSGYPCDGGAGEWLAPLTLKADDPLLIEVLS